MAKCNQLTPLPFKGLSISRRRWNQNIIPALAYKILTPL